MYVYVNMTYKNTIQTLMLQNNRLKKQGTVSAIRLTSAKNARDLF